MRGWFAWFCGGVFDAIQKECDPDLDLKGTWYVNLRASRCLPCEVDKAVVDVTMGLGGGSLLSEGQAHPFTSIMARALGDLTYYGANIFP